MNTENTTDNNESEERLVWETPQVIRVDRASVHGGIGDDDEGFTSRNPS